VRDPRGVRHVMVDSVHPGGELAEGTAQRRAREIAEDLSGSGADRFAIQVLDKNGVVYELVGSWNGASYAGGIDVAGGNVKVHME
jgi:hypothetical protein